MFIGHFAVGFAAKRVVPQVSLGALILAPALLDVLWPIFLLTGLETVRVVPTGNPFLALDLHDFPYSHSLVMSIIWSVLFAGVWLAATRDRRAALVLGALVFSHWILDWVTHAPDMPLWPGSTTYVGLGLWRSVVATLVVEGAMFVAGVALYTAATRARDRIGAIAWWSLVGLLVVFYASGLLGPPPPSQTAIGIVGLVGAVGLFALAAWADRHRAPA
jgi:membrane-bound metal-dependent hydrolase YbcI (DUF457 family)